MGLGGGTVSQWDQEVGEPVGLGGGTVSQWD